MSQCPKMGQNIQSILGSITLKKSGRSPKQLTKNGSQSYLLALEPRMMFDGAIAATTTDVVVRPLLDQQGFDAIDRDTIAARFGGDGAFRASIDRLQVDPAHGVGANTRNGSDSSSDTEIAGTDAKSQVEAVEADPLANGSNTFIFIDTAVTGYDQLVAEWQGRGAIVLIDASRDGIDQILTALAGHRNIDAIHIVSHGSDGQFNLGTTRVNLSTVADELSSSFSAIGAHLSADADIMLYGCDVGAGQAGQDLLNALAITTGADIAASVDDTGYMLRGGDWTLENRLGEIGATTLVAKDWQGLLAPALISVSSTTTVLRVYNSAGTLVSDSSGAGTGWTGGRSVGVTAGGYAVWSNAGTVGGQAVDLRAVVVSNTSGSAADVINFDRPTTTSNDPAFLLTAASGTTTSPAAASVQIRWELVLAGTNTPIAADITYTIADLDGTGANVNAATRESVVVATDTLSSFQSAGTSNVRFVTSTPGSVTAYGTQNETAAPPQPISAARFNWLNTSAWTVTYNTVRTAALTAGFSHDGNGGFNLGTGGVTTSIPRIDLDGNDSTTTGSNYRGTFTENGAAVGIVDTDVVITNPIGTIQSTTVTLTNAQTGDQLLVNGSTATSGTLAGGISYTIAGNVITLSGAATAANYAAALQAITFRNTTERPSTVDRNITIGFTNGTFASNNAVSTIRVIEINDPPVAMNDAAQTTLEDTPISNLNVLGNDTDLDGDTLTVTAASALNGTVVINANGTLNYTPNANYNGTDTITYTISDGRGGTSTATMPITITPVNDAPTAVGTLPPRANVDGASGISVQTASAFADVDGPTATYSAAGLPNGLLINSVTGEITGTINRSASQTNGGVYNVVVTRSDGSLSVTQVFSWTVTNPAPVAVNDTQLTVNEDIAGTTVNVLANDSDPDGDPISIISATATNGSVTIGTGGLLTFTPNLNYNGPATITYTISDGQGGTATATVPVNVVSVNDAPIAANDTASTTGSTPVNVYVLNNDSDPDGGTLSVTSATSPNGTVTVNPDGSVRFVANPGFSGPATVTYTISDGQGGTATATVTINVAQQILPPYVDLNGIETQTGAVAWEHNSPANTPNATIFGNGTVISAVPEVVGPGLTGTYTNTFLDVGGAASLTYEAAKAAGDYLQYSFTTGANVPPETLISALYSGDWLQSNGYKITIEISNNGFATSSILTRDYQAVVTGGNSYDGRYNEIADDYRLAPNSTYTMRVYIYDTGGGRVIFDDFQVFTTPRNPDFTNIFTENGPPVGISNSLAYVADTDDTNMESATITLTNVKPGDQLLVNGSAAATGTLPGGISYTNNGTNIVLSGSASNSAYGNAIKAIQFNNTSDTPDTTQRVINVTVNDGDSNSNTAVARINVIPVNDAPVSTAIPPQTNVDAATGINVSVASSFTDPEAGPLTFVASGLPAGLSMNSAGLITGTIDRSASQGGTGGVYTVSVTATDNGGLTTTRTFSWTVTNPVPVAANDTATTAEDTPVTVNVLANDSDPDLDPLTVISAVASVGTATVVGNQVQYTPPANFNGTATITYRISDGQGGTATATLTVNVTPVNDAPVATPIPARNTTDGATLSIPVAPNFSDVDGNTLTFNATGLPPGLTINPTTGVISGTITPNASQTNGGVYTATITASDGNGGTVTQTITINVSNPPPTANNDSASTPEDTPVTISPLANDTDPDGDPLTITSAAALNGTVTINANGTVTYTPNPGYNGTDTITYEISDGNGGTSTATITVSVADVNDVPTRSGTIANQTNLDAQVISLPVAGAFADPDGDVLSYTATGLPAGLTINPTTGVITGTIDRSASQVNGGVYAITVTASDGRGGTVSQTFSWTVTNPAPNAVNDTATTNEDTPVRIAVLANDTDPDGDPLTVTAASAGNGTVTINSDGSLVYTPNPNFNGSDTIIYRITDSEGGVSTASVTITVRPVNDAPTTVGLPNQNGDDGASVSVPTASAFRDVDGDVLTFSATGLPPALTIDPVTGVISGTLAPETSQNGPYVVTVTATDPSGASVTTSFVYSVQNIPPVATNDTATTPEDVPVRVAVLTNDRDPDGDPLTITSASANNGTVVINSDGTLTFTPAPNFNGIATISYTISDGNGGIATATLTVTVGPVNDAPVATTIPNQVSIDNAFYSAGVAPFFSDLDGDTLTYSVTGLPLGLSIDPVTGVVSGTIDRNASQVNGGVYNITVTATDPSGASVSTTFTGTVTNPAPTATNDTATTNEDTAVTIPVLANDTDPDGDPLSVTSATALNGTVTINADGTIRYTPNGNFNGEDTITYVISDGNGGTSTATVRVTVTPVNDPPVAVNDVATTNEDTPVTLNPLSNDSDVDGDPLTITAATSPNGTVTINPDGTITFTPASNFNGPTTITYTISDGRGGTSTATIAVTVDSINDVPVANPSTATTNEDTPVIVPVLANDTDADGDPLTVTAASAPNGTVVVNPDGTVTYTPNANFNGTDTITYTISDDRGGFSTSTVTVTVNAVNDAPTATPIAPQNNVDAAVVNLPVSGNFADLDGNTLTYSVTGLPLGLTIDPATGVISGTIDRSASQTNGGVYSVTVTANDGNGGIVTNIFSWNVTNPGPTATNDTATTNEDTPVTVPVLTNDNDPDGDPLTVTSATAPNGSVVINANGTITYTPNANFNGIDTITYTISDGQGGTSTATVTVTVAGVNDAPVVDTPLPSAAGVDGTSANIPTAGNFSDLDGDTLSFSAAGLPVGLVIDPATGVISGTIDRNASQLGPNADGIYSVSVTASDGRGGTVTSTFTYTVTNPGPAATNDNATTAEDTPVTVAVLANDSDPDGDVLTITAATSPDGTVLINPNGTLTFTPAANFNGPTTISYAISDGNGGTATAAVTVNVTPVNDAPTVTPIPPQNNPDSDVVSLPIAANFNDLDANPLTFSATGLPTGLTIDPATGVISGTIDRGASQPNGGVYSVTVTASDGNGGTIATTFSWTVTNPGPTATNDTATTSEDTPVTISVLANDSDPDGDPLIVTSATSPDGAVVINANGTITFTPTANFNGATTITYTISDGNGGTATATVAVTVDPVNDSPTADNPLPNQANPDGTTISVPTAASFSDLDGDTLTYSASGLPLGLAIDPTTGVISGIIDANASQPAGGIYSVTVTATDNRPGTTPATSTFVWTVTNPAPVATNDAITIAEDPASLVNIAVLANDNDPDGDPLTVTAASSPNGIVTINPDGTLDYTPNANFNGTDIITYTISDGNGGTSTATVTVTVTPVNDAPLAVGLPNLFDIDSAVVSIPAGSAFSDLEGNTLSFSATGLPAGLSIDTATGAITGTIANNASTITGGVYTVTVTANDGNGGVTATSFTWTITNLGPIAADDLATTAEDTPVTINVLIDNGNGIDRDPDGDTVTVVSSPISATNGSAVVNPDGTITFTPDQNFNGTATVTYRITDGNGAFSTATAFITVTAVNDAPTVDPLPDLSNLDGDAANIPTAGFFTDLDGNTLTYSAANLPNGLSINQNTGVITGTINRNASQVNGGVYSVAITADDGNGGTTSSTFIWTVANPAPTAVDDTASTNEDTPVTILVLTAGVDDSDPDGDPLTVTQASAPNGTVLINADGTITYTPDANFNGTDTITYTISDGNGGTSTATVTVTVAAGNDVPTATPLPARANVDSTDLTGPNTIDVSSNFSDLDGDTLTFTASGLPQGLTMDSAGIISGTILPGASQGAPNGIYSVTITANDGNGGTVSSTFSWTVTNPPPIATDDGVIAATEDTPVTIPVLGNDNDPDGDTLTVTAATSPDGTVTIDPVTGDLTFTPAANFNGPTTINYTISDGNGGTATATVTINVAPVNDAPTATPISPRTNVDSAVVSVPVASNFSDLDGNPLTYSATGLPGGLTINPTTGVISGTIAPNASQPNGGVYGVTVTANDGNGGSVSTTFSWTVTNPPPIAVNDVASTPEDFPVNINVLANDSDPDRDPLTVTTASAGNGTVVILPNGTIDYTPGPNFNGTDTITYTISDGNGGTATATVTVTVGAQNDPPIAVDDASSTDEDTPVTIPVLGNDSDLDGNPLTVTAATSPNGAVVINPDGTITFTPAPNFNGVATINYTISDDQGGTDTAVVTVVVRPVNDPPVAVNDRATTPEDTPVTVNVLGNDSDVDGNPLTVTSATSPNGAVTINPDGTITFVPTANFNGTTTITYQISDGNGGTSTATVTLTVSPVNDVPVANPSTATTNEDTPLILMPLANDTDADGDPLTVTAVSASNGTVTINPDGTVRYVPNPNFNGTDNVTYTISDGRGGTATSTVTVTVVPVNDLPVAVNDNATTPEDTPVTIPVLGNDSDADGNPLTITAATSPNGTVVVNPDGTITFTPAPNFNGPTTITYTISDGQGGTATATVTLNVTPVNDPPVARNDVATGAEDTPLRISPLTNDSDVDDNPLTIVSASSPNGTVTINPDGTITFTPDPDFNGPTTITYQISDGNGGFSTATINVTIAAVNDPPAAVNDVATTPEDTPVTVSVLLNDTDIEDNPLTVTAATSPNGIAVINSDGTITFTPDSNFNGVATVTYTISDGQGGTATATVAITVTPVNDAPVATPVAPQRNLDSATVSLPVAGNFSDVDSDVLTYTASGLPSGLSIDPATGVISGQIARDASQPNGGVYSVTVNAADGRGAITSTSFSWTVINPAPVAVNDVATTNEDTPVTINVRANDNDPDGDLISITAASAPNGTVTINADGTITYLPRANFNGTDTITYTISDGNGGSATATVTVTVVAVNDAPVARDDTAVTPIETPVTISVLANDTDVDGNPLVVTSATSPDGAVTINSDGTVTFTPAPNFTGEALITYTVSDRNGGTATAVVRVDVQGAGRNINTLLGNQPVGIPDGWLVDRIRNQSEEFITVPLIVDQTANDFRSLNPTAMLYGKRPLLDAVNAMGWLRGTPDHDAVGHPISETVDYIDRIRDIRFGADRLFDPRWGDFMVKTLTGFSVRQLDTGFDQIMIDSVVRDRVIYMEVKDIGKDSDPRIVEYQLRSRDGTPLPDWIRMDSRGLAIIERPADAQEIRLIVRAIRADGQVFDIPVVVQGATGEIQLDEKLSGKKISAAETLSQKLAASSAAHMTEAERLAAAFTGQV
jgi:large repetitive protein